MNARAQNLLDEALASHGLLTRSDRTTCPCCGDTSLEAGDFAGLRMNTKAFLAKLRERYGRQVCNACADAHQSCDHCYELVHEDKAQDGPSGEHYCQDCAGIDDGTGDHAGQETHGWEQV